MKEKTAFFPAAKIYFSIFKVKLLTPFFSNKKGTDFVSAFECILKLYAMG